MNLRSIWPDRHAISTRLVGWFLIISLLPCLALLLTTLYFSRVSLSTSVRERLIGICNFKAAQLEEYIGERKGDAQFLSNAPGFVEAIGKLDEAIKAGRGSTEEFRAETASYRPRVVAYVEAAGYANLILFNSDGVPLVSYRPVPEIGAGLSSGALKESELAVGFTRARALLQPVVSDFQIYQGHKEASIYVVGPMFRDGILIGAVALELDNAELFKAFNTYYGLGETGDATIAMREGDSLTYVAPTRFDRGTAFRDRLAFGDTKGKDIQLAVKGQRGFDTMLDHTGKPVVTAWTYLPTFRWGITVKQEYDEAFELLRKQRQAIIGFMVAAGLLVLLMARRVARTISRPIRKAAELAERVAAGDLTARPEIQANGEAGQLLRAVEAMTQDLRSLIGRIQHSSITLMSTATEIAATSRQQGEAVSDYGASTSEAAAAVKEITATSLELLRTMNEVSDVANKTAEMAGDGQGSLMEMGRSMRQLAESTTSIGSKLSVISERAGHINLAVTTIAKVADQTNLLSINAAIEAEKAGEYGLGFLVVAREIRRLADQTAVATLDIERMVKEMQYSVSAGVMEMDKFSDQVRRGVDEVGAIGEQLGGIIVAVQGLTGRFDQVNEGMRVQSQGAEQIREAVIRLSEGAHQTSISLREFNKATDHLREAVGGLKEEVSRFQLDSTPLVRLPG